MPLGGCSKPHSLHYPNFKADKLSLCTTSAILFSSGAIGRFNRPSDTTLFLIIPNRYAFRSTEKVALQEIGPRFTLKLRSLKKNIPAVYNLGESPAPLTIEKDEDEDDPVGDLEGQDQEKKADEEKEKEPSKTLPPKQDEFLWQWKVWSTVSRPLARFSLFIMIAGIGDYKTDFLFVVSL